MEVAPDRGATGVKSLYMEDIRDESDVRRSAAAARHCGSHAMTDAHPRFTAAFKREVSGEGSSLLTIMRGLWPYIWASDRGDLKLRVALSMLLLLFAKLATIAVPFTFKWATDALTGEGTAPVAPSSWLAWVFAAPILHDARLWRHARPDGAVDAVARRHVRQGRHACGAQACLPDLRAHAPAFAAVSPGAQDRRADPRAGARAQRASRPSCAW